ncbi:biopolymer transporter ExbD [Asticcacaulis excentricus]|uniref:Biopolymer transport protein ExbD/TolR n=1 Tax=Asticcacaulis excentricus (strain ATCC 15261 / DSM 4724 / KCTC 12464 / NCIMB 9791 / VKM B-1370 / CB 48) TaxID=573065 RepID=E8RRI6_ASTEC|nr:biopolymer transporter ExbD [Asticcacaulis excentricus]ADU13431.1 Biopolymer transport protein ExbD/TolR [Asticcacaulis excentricus CB 48]
MGAKLGGGGGSRYNVEQNSDINVTPFVDIMLVLLIIFMVSAPMATVSIKLDMPPPIPSDKPLDKPKDPVFISIQGTDDIYIGAKKTSLATLPADLAVALESPNPTEERVLVRGDADIEYNDFMSVLNTLQDNGYFKVALINEDLS